MVNNPNDPRRPQRRQQGRGEAGRRDAELGATRDTPLRGRPANENEPISAAMTASLRRRPSFAPYYVAFILSLLWVFLWFWSFSPAILDKPNPFATPAMPQTMVALATLVLPLALIWTAAWFIWRAHQLRQVSEVLVQTAMRLVRPQDIAADGLASIAQAVRSEVDILVGGVEHAVQRASELEGLVHKEISAIERAFGGNEERIRTLIAGLENQRAALQQAGVVIGSETNPVLARLESNTQNLDSIIASAQSTIQHLEHGLKTTTVELARTIDEVASRASVAGSEISGQAAHMERSSSIFVTELRKFSEHLSEQIGILANATGSLNAESSNFGMRIQGMESNVVQLLRSSIDELTTINGQIARTIDQSTAQSSDQIRTAGTQLTELMQSASGNIVYHLKTTSQEVAEQIEKSGIVVSQQIEASRSGMSDGLEGVVKTYVDQVDRARSELTSFVEQAGTQISGRLDESTSRLFTKLDEAARNIHVGIEENGNTLVDRLTISTDSAASAISASSAKLINLVETSRAGMTDGLEGIIKNYVEQVDNARNSLASYVEQAGNEIASRVDDSTGRLFTKLDDAARAIHVGIEENSNVMVDRLTAS
ncbi:MAG: hypothetical protein AB7S59_08280, partial [Parvibaculaceae bacterium]